TALVDMYSKCGCMAEARQVFDSIHRRDVVSWNAIITGYAHGGAAGMLEARAVFEQTSHHDVVLWNSIIHGYAQSGDGEQALEMFSRMLDRAMWTSMILGYAELGENSTALELFESMIQQQLHPESRTFVAVIKACGNLADFERGRRVHEQIRSRRGYMDQQSELVVANSLITLYGKCGCMEEARAVFDAIPVKRRDLVAWSAIISGYSQQGDACQVFDLFERMQHEKIRPDGVTFLSVLSACNHTGLVDQARKYFHALLEDYREYATIQHYSCMVDLLGRANHLEEALAVVKSMPMEPDSTIWTSILASSRKWENVEAGRAAFERIQEKDGAAFVLLANSYAGR
ncbi:hypothetical protein SELMODRAFT_45004, partial [Selaginella moellendorffii]